VSDGDTVSRPSPAFRDQRGTITDLVQGEPFDAASIITSAKGSVRGNHYHRETLQIMFVIKGRVEIVTQMPGGPVRRSMAGAGDLVRTPPIERHAIVALEDTEVLVLTKGPRSGSDYESDTYRLEEPLIHAG
jgi:oxalate decarboxylase/phosphoglucose isomerase-like protein (cupin superfamily)